jgi:hypothetical protein
MVDGVQVVTMGDMSVICGLLMATGSIVFGRFSVMAGRMLVMLRRLCMMLALCLLIGDGLRLYQQGT